MKQILSYGCLAAAMSLVIITTASAATSVTTVDIPYGNDISVVLGWLPAVVGSVLLGLLIKILPAPIQAFFSTQRTQQVEQLLERGLGYAASLVQDQVRGKELTLDVKNELIANAVQYAVDHGSAALIKYMGGAPITENLRIGPAAANPVIAEKVAARLLTSPAVNAAILGPTPK